jgi:hypothetical protein
MPEIMRIKLGDRVQMRKPHPCGGNELEVIRTGLDIRIRCLRCGRKVMMPRVRFERGVKKFLLRAQPETPYASDPAE